MKTAIDNTLVETSPDGSVVGETVFPGRFNPELNMNNGNGQTDVPPMQWSWACRKLGSHPSVLLEEFGTAPPSPGDVALVRVEKTGFHKYYITADNRRLRLYPGAQFTGVFGNRYASDA